MSDEDIIRRRLMIDGDGMGDARMMTKYVKSFIKWCSVDDSPQDNQAQFDRLLAQLSSVEHAYLKWSNVINMNHIEVKNYAQLTDKTVKGVSEAAERINTKKSELKDAEQVRRNRMEYDDIAKLIKEHPPRDETTEKLNKLGQDLNSLKEFKGCLEEKLNLRRKQMHVLVKTLHELQSTLKEEPAVSAPKGNLGNPPTIDLSD